jgi:hypothetical protein
VELSVAIHIRFELLSGGLVFLHAAFKDAQEVEFKESLLAHYATKFSAFVENTHNDRRNTFRGNLIISYVGLQFIELIELRFVNTDIILFFQVIILRFF